MRGRFAKVVLAVSLCASAAHAQPPDQAARVAWGFDRSDLTPHPGVRFGVLGNGMRYALMPTAGAPGLSVRLRIDAGSAVEDLREQGFMHLIEHLIFHGSVNLPQGALLLMLPHQGMKKWSDFNAFTSFDETVYLLDLPRADPRSRETALMLMREIAGNLLFTRRSVEGAKAMVREEIGARDGVQDRLTTAQNAFFVPGAPIGRGSVAGTQASVARARGKALQRLYETHYQPRRAMLVLVGDFDPAAVQKEIDVRFSDWQPGPNAPAVAPEQPVVVGSRGTQTHLFVDPAAPTAVTIATARPLGSPDAGPRRDALFLEHLGTQMLNARLARLGGDTAIYDHVSTARIARIDIAAPDRDWRRALRAGATELNRALAGGFTQAELDAQLAAGRNALAGTAAPLTSTALADGIVDAVGRKILFTAPADPAAAQAYLARVRLADVNAAFKAAWADSGRLIFISHDRRIPDAEAAIAATWTASP